MAAAGVDPFWHFQNIGWKEGRDPNALFDTSGYLATYADVAAAHINPLDHYNLAGWKEGRDPSVGFDTTSYLAAYTDVAAANINPLTHFLQHRHPRGPLSRSRMVCGDRLRLLAALGLVRHRLRHCGHLDLRGRLRLQRARQLVVFIGKLMPAPPYRGVAAPRGQRAAPLRFRPIELRGAHAGTTSQARRAEK